MQGQNNSNYHMINNQMPGQQIRYTFDIEEPNHRRGPQGPQEWKSGLFGCFDDCGSCCLTLWCPCVQYGKNYEKVHNDGCCSQGFLFCLLGSCGLNCCIHSGLRSDVRQRYNIQEGCNDWLVTCFCVTCAICQEARELEDRH